MKKVYYSATIIDFKRENHNSVLGKLLANDEFPTTDLQKKAWIEEILILQKQLSLFRDGDIAFEFSIPRIGHRVDVVIIKKGIVFLLEFKVGEKKYQKSAEDQVMDYALDLKYFHEASKDKVIVPIIVPTEAASENTSAVLMNDNITNVIHCNKDNIGKTVSNIVKSFRKNYTLDINSWIDSRYVPTPTIIEAAQALYRNHTVSDISRNDAGAKNLTATTKAINKIIDKCKRKKKKAICFITGVPGAGKTLAGLNIANERHQHEAEEHAVFLSGNGPLVDVLQYALAKDRAKREGIARSVAERETKAFIQIIHKFRDDLLGSKKPPIEKVTIFDEAQRAWDKKSLSDFMSRKKGISDFDQSEPEFLISVMNRHKDWATIICLVGGGQEIYKGEAGIEEWFKALKMKSYSCWNIYLSDRMTDSEYVGSTTIQQLLKRRKYNTIPELHLGVSLRSFRSERLSEFIKALLDNNKRKAQSIYKTLKCSYPFVITRNLEKAKTWVKSKARGNERYGLLASSEGKRLRGKGIWVPSKINHQCWFLEGKNNINSSFYLEVAASEFKVQGLELDYSLLAWDADFRYEDGNFGYYQFKGKSWNHIKDTQKRRYLKNAYRVLLTRARQGLVIYIPKGDPEDATRKSEFYDGTYQYLVDLGIETI